MNEYIDTNMRTELLVFLVLAFVIIVFSSFTMFTLITHLKREQSRRRHVWLLGGSAVFGIGLWSMHFLALLSTNHYSFINISMLLTLFVSSGLAYFSFLVLGSERIGPFFVRLGLATLLLGLGSLLLHYLNRLSGPVEAFHFDPVMFGLSIVLILLGAAIALLLHEMNPESTAWPASIVLGSSCMMMHMLGMRGLSFAYSEVMTTERLNEYYMVLAVMLGLATLAILGISLMTRMSDRRYRQADQRYKQLVENSIDMIAVLDGNHWEYINRSGLRLFNASEKEEMVGKSIYLFLHPKHHAETARRIGIFEAGKTYPPEELEWFTVCGKKLYTEVVIASTTLRGRPAFQLIVRDISERKKNEELLINSEKLYVAGQLAAGIAHEIRNPLTSLKGFLQLISTGRSNGRNYFDIMKSELNRIESIVSELLMLSKPQVYELTHHDMRQVLNDTVMLLEAQASLHNTEIVVETDPAPLWTFGVGNQIKQVFINVIKTRLKQWRTAAKSSSRAGLRMATSLPGLSTKDQAFRRSSWPRWGSRSIRPRTEERGLGSW